MQQQPENVAQLPKDLTDPVAAARRMTATNDVLFAPVQWRETVAGLLAHIDHMEGLLSGDATLSGVETGPGAVTVGIRHPLVALMADSLAQMIGSFNYVEMTMKHQRTGEEYLVRLQHMSRPTPHDLRQTAELEAQTWRRRFAALFQLATQWRSRRMA